MCQCIHICTYIYISVHICAYKYYIRMNMYTCVYIYIHIRQDKYMYIMIHTYVYIYTCGFSVCVWVGERICVARRVPGLPIRDCARGCNICVNTRAQMSAIDVTKKILFERLYLVSGIRTFAPWVNRPYAPTTPTVHSTTISRFPWNFFPRMTPHFFGHHDSPSNLAESRYPHCESLLTQLIFYWPKKNYEKVVKIW